MSLAVICLGVKVLQVAFTNAPVIRVLERTIPWLAWGAVRKEPSREWATPSGPNLQPQVCVLERARVMHSSDF